MLGIIVSWSPVFLVLLLFLTIICHSLYGSAGFSLNTPSVISTVQPVPYLLCPVLLW